MCFAVRRQGAAATVLLEVWGTFTLPKAVSRHAGHRTTKVLAGNARIVPDEGLKWVLSNTTFG